MEPIYPSNLIPFLKHKHLLLDTNVFRDSTAKPTVYSNLFNLLKKEDITIVTIDLVKYELVKGSLNDLKYKEKEIVINELVDTIIPINTNTFEIVYKLIKMYGIDGSALQITDLFLGALLVQYKPNLCLMTRDTSDFKQSIFNLVSIINVPINKGILTYGIYQYLNK